MEPEYIYSADRVYASLDGVDVKFIFIQMHPCRNIIHSLLSIKVPIIHVAEQLDIDKPFYDRLKIDANDLPTSNGPEDLTELYVLLSQHEAENIFIDRAHLVRYATQRRSAEILFVSVSPLRMHALKERIIRGHDGVVRPTLLVKTSAEEVLSLFNQLSEIVQQANTPSV